jgi:crotonobetainyl-CoA hydratase
MTVELTIENDVARITLNRPERLNAVDAEGERQMEKIWQQLEQDTAIRCVVLTGTGDRAFCAGADLKDGSDGSGVEYFNRVSENGFGGIALRKTLGIPVIARVNGLALGGGLEMLLGCDIIIAADHARFGLPEAKVGRMPMGGGMALLQRLIPHKIAAGMMMTGRMLSAADAATHGLVNAVVPLEELDAEVERWVSDIVACAPLSIRGIKHTLQNTGHLTPMEAFIHRSAPLMVALGSEDGEEGVRAFQEKRPPNWRGR